LKFRASRSKRGENPGVPIQPIRLIRILDAATQITQNVKCIIQIIVESGADRRRGFAAFGIRRLVKDFQTDLQVGDNLARDDQPGLAEVSGIAAAIDLTATAAKRRPWTPVFLHPDREQIRSVPLADI
jgi:hypothetical protein